uniref:(northern house mosquito) hypothetical protein n=1 Tax=Culex pipiens TaxID=7175 RepID=A0A8D8CLQ5_CULPI
MSGSSPTSWTCQNPPNSSFPPAAGPTCYGSASPSPPSQWRRITCHDFARTTWTRFASGKLPPIVSPKTNASDSASVRSVPNSTSSSAGRTRSGTNSPTEPTIWRNATGRSSATARWITSWDGRDRRCRPPCVVPCG